MRQELAATINALRRPIDQAAAQLQDLGATVTGMYGVMVSAAVPVSVLAKVAALSTLNYADAEYGPVTSAGRTEDYGEQSMNSDRARHDYAVDGTGVTVGVISDSYNKKSAPFTTAAQDIAWALINSPAFLFNH